MEPWEEIVRKHRSEFDQIEDVPRDAMWQGIRSQMDRNVQRPLRMWLGIAASVAVVLVAGAVIYNQWAPSSHIDPLAMEWEAEQSRMINLVNEKKDEIGFDTIALENYPDVLEQLSFDEAQFDQLLQDRMTHPNEEALLKVLIKYHERQLQLLERLSREAKRKEIQYEKQLY